MRFNDNGQGGPVIKAISDLDADRQAILDTIDSLNANGTTPLSETLYEAALYWRGMNAYYGENVNQYPTDPAALRSTGPERYRQPETNVCSKNFNVLLSDGVPVGDEDTPGLVGNLPGFPGSCTGTGQGRCLDDIAAYLASVDIDTTLDGDQFVTTHTIGFDIDLPLLRGHRQRVGRQLLHCERRREPGTGSAEHRFRCHQPLAVVQCAGGIRQHLQPHPEPERSVPDRVRAAQQSALARQPQEIPARRRSDH
jgi:hypothetical protein